MNILKKQGVAWVLTVVMIVLAVVIGAGSTPAHPVAPTPDASAPPDFSTFYVFDDANVLSYSEELTLSKLNTELVNSRGAVVACVTTNYGRSNLFDFALDYAADLNLTGIDFIVVLDISGENYWLIQGNDLVPYFTDDDCSGYAFDYMKRDFAQENYGQALINLVEALSEWYELNF